MVFWDVTPCILLPIYKLQEEFHCTKWSYRRSSTRASPKMYFYLSLSQWTECSIKDLPTSDAYALFMSMWHVSTFTPVCSHVCCNLWHKVNTYLSFLLSEYTFCIGYAQASFFWNSTCLHSFAYVIFPNRRTTVVDKSWYFTSCLRFPVTNFSMSPTSRNQGRQAYLHATLF
jgi:hypothetical protein